MTENTLDLVGDGDDMDVIFDAERTFGIKISNDEASDTHNVGQFYDLVLHKYRTIHPATRACLTQAAFYRLRYALKDMRLDQPITPDTSLSCAMPPPADKATIRRVWKEIGHRAGLTLPRLEIPWMPRLPWQGRTSRLGARIIGVGVVAMFLALSITVEKLTGIGLGWLMVITFAGIFALSIITSVLAHFFFATIPERIQTVGELARETAGHSFAELQSEKGGCSPSDVWYALTASLRNISSHKAPIDRETMFFTKT
jgi:hypothetical protein